ncbi:MAG: hypothetical protein KGJ46_07745 [Xanthomonadaceae bacterium]|nr:hypothetical protein [Xanthomonadaceae bacterium]
MTAGLNIHKQTNPQQAAYWGQTVGVQGFMINYVATDWQTDVGTDPDSGIWKLLRRFQSIYSQHGVTDNFIKIGLYRGHDWHDAGQTAKATRNLAHAAALARYAGLKGLALDLEPYKPTWGGSAGGPELAKLVESEGRRMGQAMHDAYPGMTLIVLPDVLRETEHEKKASSDWASTHHGGYQLSVAFVRGLLSVPWSHVVIGTEFTYSAHAERIVPYMREAAERYRDVVAPQGELKSTFSVAPGLWPLGPTARDKSARFSPAEFRQRLQVAFDASNQYVWIYGSGSAWQKDGPFGPVPGPVATSFRQFLDVIHQVRASCAAPRSPGTHGTPQDMK